MLKERLKLIKEIIFGTNSVELNKLTKEDKQEIESEIWKINYNRTFILNCLLVIFMFILSIIFFILFQNSKNLIFLYFLISSLSVSIYHLFFIIYYIMTYKKYFKIKNIHKILIIINYILIVYYGVLAKILYIYEVWMFYTYISVLIITSVILYLNVFLRLLVCQ